MTGGGSRAAGRGNFRGQLVMVRVGLFVLASFNSSTGPGIAALGRTGTPVGQAETIEFGAQANDRPHSLVVSDGIGYWLVSPETAMESIRINPNGRGWQNIADFARYELPQDTARIAVRNRRWYLLERDGIYAVDSLLFSKRSRDR